MRTVEVSPRAAREIERAENWWWEHRPKAPVAVADELSAVFEQLASQADIKPVIASRGIRRIYLRRIRYYLYYRIRNRTSWTCSRYGTRTGERTPGCRYSSWASQSRRFPR